MTKEQIFDLLNNNLAFHLATVENGEPRVRGMKTIDHEGNRFNMPGFAIGISF